MTTLLDEVEVGHNAENLIYGESAKKQITDFQELGAKFEVESRIVSTHVSKSCSLPVVQFAFPHGSFFVRNNFHDISLGVKWDHALHLDYSKIYKRMTWEEYMHEVDRCRGYSWSEWSDEDMDNPKILRVPRRKSKDPIQWDEVNSKKKDRWIKRFEDPEWYWSDWSSARIVGDFGNDGEFYEAPYTYAEGIGSNICENCPYSHGLSEFMLCYNDYDRVEEVIDYVRGK